MVAIIDYGVGNLRSLSNALKHLGIEHITTNNVDDLQSATHLILPGVGSFKYGMDQLRTLGLVGYLLAAPQPLLGICLGMQLMSEYGEEGGGSEGLGLIPGKVTKLDKPHVGWDEWRDEDYYFVHQYQNMSVPYAMTGKTQWACQFHPEKSQAAGLKFLKDFCES